MLGDIAAKMDLSTCVVDPVDPETAHVIGQFVQMDGSPMISVRERNFHVSVRP